MRYLFTRETSLQAYKLVHSFTASTNRTFPQFKGDLAQIILKAMQIETSFILGILAYDKRDRATAAKRYQESLDLAEKYKPFMSIDPNVKHLERWVAVGVKDMRQNLDVLIRSDEISVNLPKEFNEKGGHKKMGLRNEEVPIIHDRIGASGKSTWHASMKTTTDGCMYCGKRGAKLPRCRSCIQVAYCHAECQKADWKKHKLSCKKV